MILYLKPTTGFIVSLNPFAMADSGPRIGTYFISRRVWYCWALCMAVTWSSVIRGWGWYWQGTGLVGWGYREIVGVAVKVMSSRPFAVSIVECPTTHGSKSERAFLWKSNYAQRKVKNYKPRKRKIHAKLDEIKARRLTNQEKRPTQIEPRPTQ